MSVSGASAETVRVICRFRPQRELLMKGANQGTAGINSNPSAKDVKDSAKRRASGGALGLASDSASGKAGAGGGGSGSVHNPATGYKLEYAPDGKSLSYTPSAAAGGAKSRPYLFTFDCVLGPDSSQPEAFDAIAKETIADVLKGYNGSIFAYGQTGSGKTHTMFGRPGKRDRGCIPRAADALFGGIADSEELEEVTIKCSFLEIYKEVIRDLLQPRNNNLRIRELPTGEVYVQGLSDEYVASCDDILLLLQQGEKHRSTASTDMNEVSSRSHSVLIIIVNQKLKDGTVRVGKLNLADLAGSERVERTNATGDTLEEAKKINQSLSALGNCINALTDSKRTHTPFRDSTLTFLLKDSLGGNTKTTLLVCASPEESDSLETLSTLNFAKRAKKIKNSVSVNLKLGVAELTAMVHELKKELGLAQKTIVALQKTVRTLQAGGSIPQEMLQSLLKPFASSSAVAAIENLTGGDVPLDQLPPSSTNALHDALEAEHQRAEMDYASASTGGLAAGAAAGESNGSAAQQQQPSTSTSPDLATNEPLPAAPPVEDSPQTSPDVSPVPSKAPSPAPAQQVPPIALPAASASNGAASSSDLANTTSNNNTSSAAGGADELSMSLPSLPRSGATTPRTASLSNSTGAPGEVAPALPPEDGVVTPVLPTSTLGDSAGKDAQLASALGEIESLRAALAAQERAQAAREEEWLSEKASLQQGPSATSTSTSTAPSTPAPRTSLTTSPKPQLVLGSSTPATPLGLTSSSSSSSMSPGRPTSGTPLSESDALPLLNAMQIKNHRLEHEVISMSAKNERLTNQMREMKETWTAYLDLILENQKAQERERRDAAANQANKDDEALHGGGSSGSASKGAKIVKPVRKAGFFQRVFGGSKTNSPSTSTVTSPALDRAATSADLYGARGSKSPAQPTLPPPMNSRVKSLSGLAESHSMGNFSSSSSALNATSASSSPPESAVQPQRGFSAGMGLGSSSSSLPSSVAGSPSLGSIVGESPLMSGATPPGSLPAEESALSGPNASVSRGSFDNALRIGYLSKKPVGFSLTRQWRRRLFVLRPDSLDYYEIQLQPNEPGGSPSSPRSASMAAPASQGGASASPPISGGGAVTGASGQFVSPSNLTSYLRGTIALDAASSVCAATFGDAPFGFELTTRDKHSKLHAGTEQERQAWIRDITAVIDCRKRGGDPAALLLQQQALLAAAAPTANVTVGAPPALSTTGSPAPLINPEPSPGPFTTDPQLVTHANAMLSNALQNLPPPTPSPQTILTVTAEQSHDLFAKPA